MKHLAARRAPNRIPALEKELERLNIGKDQAVRSEDYGEANRLKRQADDIQAEIDRMQRDWKTEKGRAEPVVDVEAIARVVSEWTGIPANKMVTEERQRLLEMEGHLKERLIGQEEAIKAVSDAVRRARTGMKDARRPIGSFIFLGPTGVGKTELARALAGFLFDNEHAMVRLDMSEYMEKHAVSRLVGAPPGYVGYEEGGQLTEAVRRRPYAVILFDEIEKAHPDVFNMLLQILDDGRLTDSQGRTVDFKNTIVIMTSNVGAQHLVRQGGGIGFVSSGEAAEAANWSRMKETAMEALKQAFRPEFLNRVDEIIVFHPLAKPHILQIVDLMLEATRRKLHGQAITLELTQAAREHLADQGFDPSYGARPLRRAIQRQLETPLSDLLLKGEFREGDHIRIDVADKRFTFFKAAPAQAPVQQTQA
jgi:ATP-dependent Clp protease ATP-binding subunit ClpC